MSLTDQYLMLTRKMCREFFDKYYNEDSEYSFDSDCHMIWSLSSRPIFPPWPLDIFEWTYIRSIDDIWTALEYDIPIDIIHDFYRDHREDYNCKATYMKVNLWHYYRMNYDPDVFQQEIEDDKKKSTERIMEISWSLDEMLWQEKLTFYNQYIKNSLSNNQ